MATTAASFLWWGGSFKFPVLKALGAKLVLQSGEGHQRAFPCLGAVKNLVAWIGEKGGGLHQGLNADYARGSPEIHPWPLYPEIYFLTQRDLLKLDASCA